MLRSSISAYKAWSSSPSSSPKSASASVGERAERLMSSGQLVDDETVVDLVESTLLEATKKNDGGSGGQKKGWLLDGYPRTGNQASRLRASYPPDLVIVLKVPDDVLMDRSCGRRYDPLDKKVYHVSDFNDPEKRSGKEDLIKRLVVRDDDKPETVKNRLEVYARNLEAVKKGLDLGNKGGVPLLEVDGLGPKDEVWGRIEKGVRAALAKNYATSN